MVNGQLMHISFTIRNKSHWSMVNGQWSMNAHFVSQSTPGNGQFAMGNTSIGNGQYINWQWANRNSQLAVGSCNRQFINWQRANRNSQFAVGSCNRLYINWQWAIHQLAIGNRNRQAAIAIASQKTASHSPLTIHHSPLTIHHPLRLPKNVS